MFVSSDKIDGDYLEFGVFRGGSFAQSYHALTNAFEIGPPPRARRTRT